MNITSQVAENLSELDKYYKTEIESNVEIQIYNTGNGYRWRDSRHREMSCEYRITFTTYLEMTKSLCKHLNSIKR